MITETQFVMMVGAVIVAFTTVVSFVWVTLLDRAKEMEKTK